MAKDILEVGKRMVNENLVKNEFRESKNILMKSLSSCDACPIKDTCSITKLMKPKDRENGCREIRSLYKENFNAWSSPILQLRIRLADLKTKIQLQAIIDIEKNITVSKRMKMLLDLESKYIDKLMKYCPPDKKESKEISQVVNMDYIEAEITDAAEPEVWTE